jgi:hypothetical protein
LRIALGYENISIPTKLWLNGLPEAKAMDCNAEFPKLWRDNEDTNNTRQRRQECQAIKIPKIPKILALMPSLKDTKDTKDTNDTNDTSLNAKP